MNSIQAIPSLYTPSYTKKIIGMIGFHTDFLYTQNEIYAAGIAFIVDANYRNKGMGRLLLTDYRVYITTV
ncbi:GNAT family N-acetyltransferase [Bacillus cereus]|uniref:GNAT family N-acetyltransferase n=1 Tax=Bacillus sp. 491mf TaxID=1761755 RepID=UPI0015A5BF68|nr:GNAT family N-acetyltransferase [Bacillus sp. 491mf]